jgi:hypothetical protein
MRARFGSATSGIAIAVRVHIFDSRTWAFRRSFARGTPLEINGIFPALTGVLRLCLWLLAISIPLVAQSAMEIRIVEGEGIGYAAGSRATRGIAVQVSDGAGNPVQGANVIFVLPDDGPTGVFTSGGRMELAVTGADGRASAWGMRWNRITGPLELRITATKGLARANIVCPLNLTEAPPKVARSHRLLWIGIAVAGGVVGAVAARGGSSAAGSSSSAAVVSAPTIGAPTLTLSHP